jgi:hypothetical protein
MSTTHRFDDRLKVCPTEFDGRQECLSYQVTGKDAPDDRQECLSCGLDEVGNAARASSLLMNLHHVTIVQNLGAVNLLT